MTRPTAFLIDVLRRLGSGTRGSLTLEATIVTPILFGAACIFLIMSLFVFQQGMYYSGAARSSEAAAFHWDNSKRDAHSGLPPAGEDDGLYWKLSGDGLLRGLLNMGQPPDTLAEVTLEDSRSTPAALPAVKLAATARRLGQQLDGELRYKRSAWKGSIETHLYRASPVQLPGGRKLGAAASAQPVDPVEFIRTVDAVRYYSGKFRSSKDISPDKAGKVLLDYGG